MGWSETKEGRKDRILKHRYGIRLREYDRLLADQDGRCGVCRDPFGSVAEVDHDHSSEEVRGLVCRRCNAFLGYLDKDPKLAEKAVIYLRKVGVK